MTTVTVSSVAQLRAALADMAVTTILVTPGDYAVNDVLYYGGSGDGFYINHDVTIKADTTGTARANFLAGTDFSKGLFHVIEGASANFDGIGFYNTRTNFSGGQSSNEAGIRHEGVNLTIRNCYFENNLNGILGTSRNGVNGELHGDLLVKNSIFLNNGDQDGAGQEHQIYFTGRSATVDQSRFTNSGYGHSVKTIVDIGTIVTNSIINDNGAPANSAINATGGGTLTITGNIITKSAEAQNLYFVYYQALRDGGVPGAINISGNTFTSLKPAGSNVILLGNYSETIANISNNILTGAINVVNPVDGDATGTGNTLNGNALALLTPRARAVSGTSNADTKIFSGTGYTYANIDPNNSYNGLGGNDTIIGSFAKYNTDVFFGGDGNDILSGGDGADFLYGEGGDDLIFVGEAVLGSTYDSAFGGAGNDRLIIRPSDFRNYMTAYFDGGDGNDLLDVRAGQGAFLLGGAGDDIALGGSRGDGFNGGYGSDVFYGGLGQEGELWGGPADDTGIDTMVYAGAYGVDEFVQVTALTAAGTAEVGYYENPRDFEFLQFSNGSYDTATKIFTAGLQRINLTTLLATPVPVDPGEVIKPYRRTAALALTGASITGTTVADVLIQTEASQTISGGDGNDQYVLDVYYPTLMSYPVINESFTGGIDTVFIRPGYLNVGGEYSLAADVEIGVTYELTFSYNALKGNTGDNLLVDFDRKNLLIVESNETVKFDGGDGNDTLYGGNGNDTLVGGNGTDVAIYRGNKAEYTLAFNSATQTTTIIHTSPTNGINDGVDTLQSIEQVRFLNGTVSLNPITGTVGVLVGQNNSATSIAYSGGTFNLVEYTYRATPPVFVLGPLVAGGYPVVTTRNGTAAVDNLVGGAGVDYFNMPGDVYRVDTVAGGAGDDIYAVEQEDVISETATGGWDVMVANGNITIASNVEVMLNTNQYAGYSFGNANNNLLITNDFLRRFSAGGGNDVMVGSIQSDEYDGSTGIDTVVMQGNYASYSRSLSGAITTFTHASRSEADSMLSVENIRFADGLYDVTANSFTAYTFASSLESDLRNAIATQTFLNLPTVFSDIGGTGKLFIRGDVTDTVVVNAVALKRFDTDYVRAGVSYRHYAYGTNDIFIESGVQLTSPFSSIVPINQALSSVGGGAINMLLANPVDSVQSSEKATILSQKSGLLSAGQAAVQLSRLIDAMASFSGSSGALDTHRFGGVRDTYHFQLAALQ
jgi:hypothetical protein